LKQREYIGFESIKQLGSVLNELLSKRIFLVTGKASYSSSGAEKHLSEILGDYEIVRFFNFSSNPKIEDVEKGIELFCQLNPDAVIAIGGGSVIDTAKLVNFFSSNNLNPAVFFKTKKVNIRKPKPIIAIPTTAGAGSEATHFAVLYIDKKKFSVDNEFILPDVAIVDPCLTMSLPKYVTAVTGMDALSQAIESYWSINSNDESKKFARGAIKLIMDNLVIAVNEATSSARLAMAKAAHLAGKAINITRTTAPHAISYPLTAYFGISHGHAVALTLPAILEYNAAVTQEDLQDSRGYEYVKKTISEIASFLGQSNVAGAKEVLIKLMNQIGLQTCLGRLGVSSIEDIETIVSGFNPDRAANNPRRLNKQALRKILRTVQ